MIDLKYIRSFFPPTIAKDSRFDRYMLKEYLQLLILDHLAITPYINKVSFIGGTNLRLIQGIDRFSEDLDFDCKDLSKRCVLIIIKFYLNYLCLCLSLFGIFALNALNRSSLRFFNLENKSAQK